MLPCATTDTAYAHRSYVTGAQLTLNARCIAQAGFPDKQFINMTMLKTLQYLIGNGMNNTTFKSH